MKPLLAFLLISFSHIYFVNAQNINVAYGVHNSPPYVKFDNENKLIGGHFVDLAKFISQELNLRYTMVPSPRIRIEALLKSGDIDIYCNSNKDWVKNEKDFYWFENIYRDENILYGSKKQDQKIERLEDVNVKIGTIYGFSYHPRFEKLLRRVGRYELKNHENLLGFLRRKRVDMIISSKVIAEEFIKNKKFNLKPVTSFRDSFSYACIISKSIKFKKNDLLKALTKYKLKMR